MVIFGVEANVRTLYPTNLPRGDRPSTESFGFWFRLLFFGTMTLVFLVGGSCGATSTSDRIPLLLLGTLSSLVLLAVGFRTWGYVLAVLCNSAVAKFYLYETTATISKRVVRVGDEFEFIYRQSFRRRALVRKFRIELAVRQSVVHEEEGNEETITWEDEGDTVIEEFNRSGWQTQPGESFQDTATFHLTGTPMVSYPSEWLIKVYLYLNRPLVVQQVYRLQVSLN